MLKDQKQKVKKKHFKKTLISNDLADVEQLLQLCIYVLKH